MCPPLRNRYAGLVSKITFAFSRRLLLRMHGGEAGLRDGTYCRSAEPHPRALTATASATAQELLSCDALMTASALPILVVDAATGRIEEGNPAAAAVFGSSREALMGSGFLQFFDPACGRSIRDAMNLARDTGSAEAPGIRTAAGVDISLKLSLFHTDAAAYLLAHPATKHVQTDVGTGSSGVFEAVHELPIGFLVTDMNFRVEYANRTFLRMVECRAQDVVRGQPLGRWLKLTEGHWARLRSILVKRRAVEELSTTLRCGRRLPRNVRVSAIAVPDGRETRWGFCVSDATRLN